MVSAGDYRRKTDCFGETRLVPHVPSSSCYDFVITTVIIIITVIIIVTTGAGQAPSKPLSLLQRVAQDAKRNARGGAPGGVALARELSQAHSIPPPGVLPPPKFQSSTAQPAQPASSASGKNTDTLTPVC